MDELSAIRAKRLAELSGGSPGVPIGSGGGADAGNGSQQQQQQQQQQQAQKREEEEDARRQMLGQILSPEARERLSRIALVRPERSRAISELLIRMARSGQLRGKVSEQQLLGVLEQVEANERGANGEGADGKGKIVFQRRKAASNDGFGSSDDDDVSFRPSTSTARRKRTQDDDDDDFDL